MSPLTTPQKLMVWGLRALVLWAVFEAGVAGLGAVARIRETQQAISGHAAAMARLDHRADEAERAGRREAQALLDDQAAVGAGALTLPAGYTPDRAITVVIRKDLLAAGALSPQVTTTVTPTAPGFYRAIVQARWDEGQGTTPSVLASLAERRPYIGAARLTAMRPNNGATATLLADLQFTFQIRKEAAK